MSWLTILGLILFFGGAAGVLFVIFRKIPTLVKLPQQLPAAPETEWYEKIKNRFKAMRYSTYQPMFLNWLEKSLRKFRLLILKIDNLFIDWIKSAREKSEVWTVRSRAWMEHRRFKKKEKAQVLEKLDKAEVSETLEKIEQEVAKEEDEAFKEKVEILNSVDGEKTVEPAVSELKVEPDEEEILTVSEDEKKYIDVIAQNPKDITAYRALCDIYLKQQNYSDARACFRQLLKLAPGDADAKAKLENIKGLKSSKKTASGAS